MIGCCKLHSLFISSHVAPTCTSADDEGSVASAIAHPTTAPTRPPPVSTISTSWSSSSLTRTDARRGGSVTSTSGSTRSCPAPRPVIGFRSSNQKVAPATRKRKNEQDDNDAIMKNMMAFMLEDRKLKIENRKHEIAAQMEIQRIEEQARKEDRIAAERVRSEDMEMQRQEFRMMSMLVMQMASTNNNNFNNRLVETDRSSELVTQHSLVSQHLHRLAITLFFCLF
jgi:hypothetical protein